MAINASSTHRPLIRVPGSSELQELPVGEVLALNTMNVREPLTAARTYYVDTTGSDSNDGSALSPFLTIQKAVDVASSLDNNGFAITIQVADGTYTTATNLKSFIGSGQITIKGNNTTPANVVINCATTCFTARDVSGTYRILDLKITSSASGAWGIYAVRSIVIFGNIEFGAMSGTGIHLYADEQGELRGGANYKIVGSATYHFFANLQSIIRIDGLTVTLTGTPAFTTFAYATDLAAINAPGVTYSGSATGQRHYVDLNSVSIGGTYPGNTAGATATGGQHV